MKLHLKAPELSTALAINYAMQVHTAFPQLTLVTVNGGDDKHTSHAFFELEGDEVENIQLLTDIFARSAAIRASLAIVSTRMRITLK